MSSRRTEGLHKKYGQWKIPLQSFQPVKRFLKEFNLSTLSTSNVSDEGMEKPAPSSRDHGRLSSSGSHNERPSWIVEHNRSRSNSNGYRLRSREEPESSVFGIVTFCFTEFDTSVICYQCGVYALFRLISIAKYVLKSLSVGFQFEGQSLKYSVSMFQRKVDNWKPQAGSHVTGVCRRSISGRNDLLLSFPTGVPSLPLAPLFLIFSHAFFCAAPSLTERLEEANLFLSGAIWLYCKFII